MIPVVLPALVALGCARASYGAGAATAPSPGAPPSPTPVLVVAIVVDQMRGDYLDRFGPQLTGGLARLVREGAVFSDAYQDHAMSETAPGHATVLSGRNPTSTGIVRNDEGVSDSSSALLEVTGPGASPWRFRGTGLFDWMQARWPAARALSVSRKDRGAILPIGRSKQQVYWYQSGQFTTSRYYADALPDWVRRFNAAAVAARAPGSVWDLLLPADSYGEPDAEDYENRGRDLVFPHRLPADSAAAAQSFMATPPMDSLTLAFALEGVQRLGLGAASDHPDLLNISLSATDYIGHYFGQNSREMHDQVLRLDRALGRFLDSLGRLRDLHRVVLVLTADHGVTSFPAYANRHGDPRAQFVSLDGLVRAYRADLAARAGPGQWIRYFDTGLLVMDRTGLAAKGVNVDSVVARMAEEIRRLPPVLRVDTRASLMARDTASDWIARRWLNVLPSDLGAELMVTLEPHMSWGTPGIAQHGQPSDDDTHVTLLLWGDAVHAGRYGERVSVVDIAPTLADVLGVRPLEWVQGRVLREALRSASASH